MRIASFFLILLFTCCITANARPKELTYQGIRNIKLAQGTNGSSLITLDVAFFNPNPFTVKMKKADVDVYVNDRFLGKTLQDKMVSIAANDSTQLSITVNVKLEDLLGNALQLLSGGPEIRLRLLGHIKVGRGFFFVRLPVDYVAVEKI